MYDAYRVGESLAYLVRRMPTFLGVVDGCVVVYKSAARTGIPKRMPAIDVVKAQAHYYPQHRGAYPENHRAVLDAGVSRLSEPAYAERACDGLLCGLSGMVGHQIEERHHPEEWCRLPDHLATTP